MNYIYAKTQHNTYENHQAEITPIDHIIFAVDETCDCIKKRVLSSHEKRCITMEAC